MQKHEYIDFDELIPPPPSINTDQYFGLELDEFSSPLLLKKTKQKFQIRDLPSWMCAWNVFVQAYLHFQPTMQFDLFNYLKIFCTLIKKFKFENCYAYDKALNFLHNALPHLINNPFPGSNKMKNCSTFVYLNGINFR